MKELLINYCKYNLWANTKITDYLKKLTPALLDKELISSFKTIRKTVYHIWDAEQIWYNRLAGISFSNWPSESYKGTDAEFIKMFLEESNKFVEYTEHIAEPELLRRIDYKSLEGKEFSTRISDIILHCMNYSTFHRGQIVTMLRNVGFTELDSTDYIMYSREKNL